MSLLMLHNCPAQPPVSAASFERYTTHYYGLAACCSHLRCRACSMSLTLLLMVLGPAGHWKRAITTSVHRLQPGLSSREMTR